MYRHLSPQQHGYSNQRPPIHSNVQLKHEQCCSNPVNHFPRRGTATQVPLKKPLPTSGRAMPKRFYQEPLLIGTVQPPPPPRPAPSDLAQHHPPPQQVSEPIVSLKRNHHRPSRSRFPQRSQSRIMSTLQWRNGQTELGTVWSASPWRHDPSSSPVFPATSWRHTAHGSQYFLAIYSTGPCHGKVGSSVRTDSTHTHTSNEPVSSVYEASGRHTFRDACAASTMDDGCTSGANHGRAGRHWDYTTRGHINGDQVASKNPALLGAPHLWAIIAHQLVADDFWEDAMRARGRPHSVGPGFGDIGEDHSGQGGGHMPIPVLEGGECWLARLWSQVDREQKHNLQALLSFATQVVIRLL